MAEREPGRIARVSPALDPQDGPVGLVPLSARTGRTLWFHRTEGNAKVGVVYSRGLLYHRGRRRAPQAMNPGTGKTIWKVDDGGVDNNAEPLAVDGPVINPAGGPRDTSLWAFNRRTGARVWRHRGDDADNTPTCGDGLVDETNVLPRVVGGRRLARGVITAVRVSTDGGCVFIGDNAGWVDVLAAATGRTVARRHLGGVLDVEPMTIVDGTLYVAAFTGDPLVLADPGFAPVTPENTGNVFAMPVSSLVPR